MKFKDGDRFVVKESGYKGVVVKVEELDRLFYYATVWDHSRDMIPQLYAVEKCDDIWELDSSCPVVQTQWRRVGNTMEITIKPPQSIDFIPIDLKISDIGNGEPVMCRVYGHEWVNAGFHFTKEVCKRCDTEKKGG